MSEPISEAFALIAEGTSRDQAAFLAELALILSQWTRSEQERHLLFIADHLRDAEGGNAEALSMMRWMVERAEMRK